MHRVLALLEVYTLRPLNFPLLDLVVSIHPKSTKLSLDGYMLWLAHYY